MSAELEPIRRDEAGLLDTFDRQRRIQTERPRLASVRACGGDGGADREESR